MASRDSDWGCDFCMCEGFEWDGDDVEDGDTRVCICGHFEDEHTRRLTEDGD